MKSVMANTKTAKGLTMLNLASICTMIIFLILIPALQIFVDVVSFRIVYIITIVFIAFNILFYILPQNKKILVFQKRLLVVYLPTLVVVGLGIWSVIAIIITLSFTKIMTLFFTVLSCLQPITFSLLIAKLVSEQPTLLA